MREKKIGKRRKKERKTKKHTFLTRNLTTEK